MTDENVTEFLMVCQDAENNHRKVWTIRYNPATEIMVTRWGRIRVGSKLSLVQIRECARQDKREEMNPEKAKAHVSKMVKSKAKKGYVVFDQRLDGKGLSMWVRAPKDDHGRIIMDTFNGTD